jgi:hypothetical protein
MIKPSREFLNLIEQVREDCNTVFIKVCDGIYCVYNDRLGSFTGRSYVSTTEVIDELNINLKVAIYEKNSIGTFSAILKSA